MKLQYSATFGYSLAFYEPESRLSYTGAGQIRALVLFRKQ